jgi:peptide/nickel transport system substrate-binding protein
MTILLRARRRLLPICVLLLLAVAVPAHAAPDGTLTFALHFAPVTKWLDPGDGESVITAFLLYYAMHDAMLKPLPGQPVAPSLAESYTAAKDGLSIDLTLRPAVKFHDGTPITAEDVKFSYDRYKGAASNVFKANVKEVVTPAPNRVRFVFREPWPDFLAFYGTLAGTAGWVVPKKYIERVGDDGFRKAPIGAGPYKFVSFNPGTELVLEAFEGYWRKTPSIKRIVFKVLPDETSRAAALKAGHVDIAMLLSGPNAEEIRRTPGMKLVAPLLGIFWLDFPDQWDPKSPWADRRVRLAASHAIDRQALNQAETLGLSRPVGSIVPRDFEFALPFDAPAYDPARARKLLAEAGHPNGFDAGELTPFPPYTSMGEAIAGWLQTVGIRTRMRTMERGAFMTSWREKKLKGVVLTITGISGNAASRLEPFVTSKGGFSYGGLPEVDDLYRRQAKETDKKKREALLHQLQRVVHDQVLNVPVYHLGFPTGVGPRMDDIHASIIPAFYFSPYEDLKFKPR